MNYIVIEYQTTNENATSVLTSVHATREEAEQKYHMVLSAAAVSGLKYHGAELINAFGDIIKNEHYPEIWPGPEIIPEPETVSEPETT